MSFALGYRKGELQIRLRSHAKGRVNERVELVHGEDGGASHGSSGRGVRV